MAAGGRRVTVLELGCLWTQSTQSLLSHYLTHKTLVLWKTKKKIFKRQDIYH